MKLSNKAALLFYSPLKSSFASSKLRFFGLRRPKISSCYTISAKKEGANILVRHPLFYLVAGYFLSTARRMACTSPFENIINRLPSTS